MPHALIRFSVTFQVLMLVTASPCRAQVNVETRADLIAAINNTSIPWMAQAP